MSKLKYPHIIIARSSAGSGKTWNLALRYLQTVLARTPDDIPVPNGIGNILAVTFTNKAANEMKERIIKWMKFAILDGKLDGQSVTELLKQEVLLKDASGKEERISSFGPNVEIKNKLSSAFDFILSSFHKFRISTIDSFNHQLLKAASFRLHIPPDFELSLGLDPYLNRVTDLLFLDVVNDSGTKEIFTDFITEYSFTRPDLSWNVKKLLGNVMNVFWKKENNSGQDVLPAQSLEPGEIAELRGSIRNKAVEIMEAIGNDPKIKVKEHFHNALRRFLDEIGKFGTNDAFFLPLATWIGRDFVHEGGKSSLLNKGSIPVVEIGKKWESFRSGLQRVVENISAARYKSFHDVYRLFKQRLRSELTQKSGTVLISELNSLLRQITAEHIPDIYLNLAEKYWHFLVDEFQDTNIVQWQNLRLLVDESLSKGGSLFVVGDKKQSIYRWRGAESGLVDEVRKNASAGVFDLDLDTNYRSCENIVDFNNKVFSINNLAKFKEMKLDGTPLDIFKQNDQKPGKKGDGYVRVKNFWPDRKVGDEPLSNPEMKELIHREFQATMSDIRKRNAWSLNRTAVLVRNNREIPDIINWLLEDGIEVISSVTVDIRNNILIRELTGFLRFLSDVTDDMSFFQFITGDIMSRAEPTSKFWDWAEKTLRTKQSPLYDAFRGEYHEVWNNKFDDAYRKAGYLPLYDLVLLIVSSFKMAENFPEQRPTIFKFLETVLKREQENPGDIKTFLEYLETGGDEGETSADFSLESGEDLQGVQVMTFHKAKGLEFDCVIIPFAQLNPRQAGGKVDSSMYWIKSGNGVSPLYMTENMKAFSVDLNKIYEDESLWEESDELNGLYVAFTRPKKELHVFINDKGLKNLISTAFREFEASGLFISGNPVLPEEGIGDKRKSGEMDPPSSIKGTGYGYGLGPRMKKIAEILDEKTEAENIGEAVHFILEKAGKSGIAGLPEERGKIAGIISFAICKYNIQDHVGFRTRIEKVFSNPEMRRFFVTGPGDTAYTERTLLDERGKAHRADRFTVRKDRIELVDFKTGNIDLEEHGLQVRGYARLLEGIFKMPVRSFLLYVDHEKIVEIANQGVKS